MPRSLPVARNDMSKQRSVEHAILQFIPPGFEVLPEFGLFARKRLFVAVGFYNRGDQLQHVINVADADELRRSTLVADVVIVAERERKAADRVAGQHIWTRLTTAARE